MKEEDLKKLIVKYYDGESNEDEERALREYFRQDHLPDGYEAEKVIFGYYLASEEVPEPSLGFEARILAGIDASEKVRRSQKMKKYLLPVLSAAAGMFIIAGSYFFFVNRAESVDTFKDPKIAYTETIKILLEVSSRLNRGTQALEPVGKLNKMTEKSFESINRSTKIVEKSLKSLDYLQKAPEITNEKVDINKNK